MSIGITSEYDVDEQAEPVKAPRRGLLGRAASWVLADHLRRGPVPLIAATYGAAAGTHALGIPGLPGVPVTVLLTIGMYTRAMNQPAGSSRPGLVATATAAGGAWFSAATAWGVTAGPAGLPYLTTWLGLGVGALAYWAYRIDPAIQGALAWEQACADWHMKAPRYGLKGSHLLDWAETRLGERFTLDTVGTGRRASALAGGDIEERIAEQESLPTSRVKVRKGGIAGRLTVSIRYKDPWAEDLPHPLLDPAPEIPLPDVADAREPIIIGMDPETGRALEIVLWDEDGAKRVMIIAIPGAGKSVILSNITERITAADNAWPIGIDVSKAKELRRWASALGASACGPDERVKALRLLEMARHIIVWRAANPINDEATVVPRRTRKLVPVLLDEQDELLSYSDPIGLATRKEFAYVASKGRSEGVAIVAAGQRGTATDTGGGKTRSMYDQMIIGKVNRKSEMQHAVGEFGLTLPNMAAYGEGKAGVVLVTNLAGRWEAGRGWRLDKLTYIDRLVDGRSAGDLEPGLMAYLTEKFGADLLAEMLRPGPLTPRRPKPAATHPAQTAPAATTSPLPEAPMPHNDEPVDHAAQHRAHALATLASTGELNTHDLTAGQRRALAIERRRQAADQTEMPDSVRELIIRMASAPEGTTTRKVEQAMEAELDHERGISKSGAWRCLDVLRFAQVVELRGKGRGASWHTVAEAIEPAKPAPAEEFPDEAYPDIEQIVEAAEDEAADALIDEADDHEE